MPATRIEVNIPGEVAYDVRVGEGLLSGIGAYCRGVSSVASCPQILIISDSNVAPLYVQSVRSSLAAAGYAVNDITVPAGEGTKSVEVAGELWEAMAALKLGRDCAVLALGGGVVGDLAGFVGSTFMRGIPIIQVPTTLLSMVDSSVGGKTAINLSAGKNLVGTFTQPAYVCASTDVLSTLPEREWLCGLGEVAKSAVIDSDDFFFWLMDHAQDIRNRELVVMNDAICRCVVFKAGVVAEDKTESRGVRECLNYGHTLAHAVESLAGYGTYSHGAAVAEGMRFAALLGQRLGLVNADFAEAQAGLLDELGLPKLDFTAPAEQMLDSMKGDKKVRDGKLRFVIARDVAQWEIVNVPDTDVLAALKEF